MPSNENDDKPPVPGPEDYYFENGLMVFTAAYHLKRGSCCGSGCRHCPYGHIAGSTGPVSEPAAVSATTSKNFPAKTG